MKHSVSRELHSYWDRLRGTRAAPERSDLDPGAIRSILADTFLAEVTGGPSPHGRDLLVRLSGTRLNALFATDLKGHSLFSVWQGQHQGSFADLLDLVLDEQTPVVAGARLLVDERTSIGAEILLLPLRHRGDTHARVLGSISPTEAPRWLGLRPGTLALTSYRSMIDQEPRLQTREPAATRREPARTRHGRFRVVQGGRGLVSDVGPA